MDFITTGLLTAAWLGILTSISPCPMATNIAAISFIGKNVKTPVSVMMHGVFYTLGRMLSYLLIAIIIVNSILSLPEIARFLQKYMNIILSPLLIIVGVYLLDLIKLNFGNGIGFGQQLQDKARKQGLFGSLALGSLFAVSFCPVSAGLFFGSLIPLSIKYESGIIMPLIYGIGTALPVVIFAILIGISTNYVAKLFNRLTIIERWSRRITGIVFIAIGLYLLLERL